MDNLGRDNMAQGVRQAEIRPMLFDMEPIISLCRGFRRPDGSKGVYACCNEQCSCAHTDGALKLGDIFLNDSYLTCPHCGSAVYELYNDRRCGALFFRGFIHERDMGAASGAYLWRYPGQTLDGMKEIHLFLPEEDYRFPLKQGKFALLPCYLDVKSGFINFRDDLWENQPNVRKLYYSRYQAKGRPQTLTFTTCPHCRHQMSSKQLTSFATRGNQSFGSLIQTQFRLQNPVPGKDNDPERLPNAGRKVLLFSDSRQRAAMLLQLGRKLKLCYKKHRCSFNVVHVQVHVTIA